nr:ribosome maturation factor RimP [Candidatus Omnitrophota bacterium]
MVDKIKEIIEPILQEEQVELVEIIFRREAGRQVLRLLVDRDGGIKLADCTRLNERISQFLDERDIIQESYVIEVDSPGIDRPFKTKRDYERAIGRLVRVTLSERIQDKKEYVARLEEVSDMGVKIDVKKKGLIEIPFEKIVRAREEVEF